MAAKDTKLADMDNETLEAMIDAFMDYIVIAVDVSHILLYLHIKEVLAITKELHTLEGKGQHTEAGKKLLEAIKKSDEPGKWQQFVGALRAADGEGSVILFHLFDGDLSDPWVDKPEHRKLIQLFTKPLKDQLSVELIIKVYEEELIVKDEKEKLEKLIRGDDKVLAQGTLIAAMCRRDKLWYKKFLTILYEFPGEHFRPLAELIDPGFVDDMVKKKKRETETDQPETDQSGKEDQEWEQLRTSEAEESSSRARQVVEGPGNGQASASSAGHEIGNLKDIPVPLDSEDAESVTSTSGRSNTEGHATCACGCCVTVSAEVTALKAEVTALKQEISGMKVLFEKVLESSKHQSDI